MMLPLPALTRITRCDSRTGRSVTMSYEPWPWPAGSIRPSSAHACSSGSTGRKPSRPFATRGITSATSRGAAAQAMASRDGREAGRSVSSVFCVGVSSFSEALRASASAGAIQSCSTSSVPSWAAVWASGAAAMKKRVSKRLARPERRQPVAQVDQPVDGQAQALGRAELGDAFARSDGARRATARAAPRRRRRGRPAPRRRRARTATPTPRSTRAPPRRSSRGRPPPGRAGGSPRRRRGRHSSACAPASFLSTMPPGKTQALLLWSPRSARRESSTSMPFAPSRTTTIVAAGRGGRCAPLSADGAGNAEASGGGEAGIDGKTGAVGAATFEFDTPTRVRGVGRVRHRRGRAPDIRSADQPIGKARRRGEDSPASSMHAPRAPGVHTCFTMPSSSS